MSKYTPVANMANFALQQMKSAIKEMLEPYGDKGLELTDHTNKSYSVMCEVKPLHFVRVARVRKSNNEVQMLLVGETEWKPCGFTDWFFLFDEIRYAVGDLG